MLERKPPSEQFTRKNKGPIRNIIGTLRNLKTPWSENEIDSNRYLKSLKEIDRQNVQSLLNLTPDISEYIRSHDFPFLIIAVGSTVNKKTTSPNFNFLITAVGSTVNERMSLPNDLDLRILFFEKNKDLKDEAIKQILNDFRTSLKEKNISYKEERRTTNVHMERDSKKGTIVDTSIEYSDDRSITVDFDNGGLPIHMSFAGPKTADAEKYLRKDRRRNGHFAILFDSRTLTSETKE